MAETPAASEAAHPDAATRREVLSTFGAATASALAGCSTADGGRLDVSETALRDEVTPVRLRGFPADTSVTVAATGTYEGTPVASATTVTTGSDGTATVGDADDPAAAMRWLWSMSPSETASPTATEGTPPSLTVDLAARVDGERVATATQTRRYVAPDVTRRSIDREDLVGELFLPAGSGPHPGVLVLHGSGGVPLVSWGRLLAAHGLAALAVDYFGPASGNPGSFVSVPLSYFDRAARLLRDRDAVRDGAVGVVGASRGTEAALLSGVHFDWVGAVAALAPSCYVWRGEEPTVPAWRLDGEPVPYLDFPRDDGDRVLAPAFRGTLREASDEAVAAATIPVEEVGAPLLFVSGGDDRLWPSGTFANRAVRRLERHGDASRARHLHYEDAGHAVSLPPYIPTWWTTETERYVLGGTPAANARATADAWPSTLSVLRDALGADG
ncbi:acyl-CoA thioester hydrolase/BAAT C-terminal domain-containing protein [Haloarcula litorea]|uniref:acyl-CoA thioester hydrolase/BAAT C-terminal domain-containing protein n=1 Tax=Haloarcula litorea TaxID=3032579 RepID=UPI0023E8118F|nr:acyl-CoA thioester hydrolase/BAAT C-terminal domain-containing protein [Halomicroarcula sp. GDY20]